MPTQLGLFGRPAQDLKAVLARLGEDDRRDVAELARSALAEHGAATVAAWLHQAAAWTPARWRGIRNPTAYLGATLARTAAEVAIRGAEEAQARAVQEAEDARRREEDAAHRQEMARDQVEADELRMAFEALSPGEREQVVVEATGRLSPIWRNVADPSRPLDGSLGNRVRDVLKERRDARRG